MTSTAQNLTTGAAKISVGTDLYKKGNQLLAGKKLFGPGNYALAPTVILDALKLAGIPVPKGAQVSLEIAQILMAGGQISSNIQNASAIGSYINPVGAVVEGVLKLSETMGWLDAKDPKIQALEMGVDLALVVGGGGTNVLADIKFAMDVVNQFQAAANAEEAVKGQAQAGVSQQVFNYEKPQMAYAAAYYSAYQSGNLSIFEFMGKVAQGAPALFKNFFPEVGSFMPTSVIQFCTKSSTSTLFGGYRDYTACDAVSFVTGSKGSVQNAILNNYVYKPMLPFFNLDVASQDKNQLLQFGFPKGLVKHPNPVHRISSHSLALLSMLPPYFDEIPTNFNIIPTLVGMDITPSDLEASPLFDEINASLYGSEPSDFFKKVNLPTGSYQGNFESSGIGYQNRMDLGTQVIVNDNVSRRALIQDQVDPEINLKQKILDLDNWREFESISKLLNIKEAYWIMREWGVTPNIPDPNPELAVGKIPSYRFLRNYWGALAMLDKILKDKFFNDISLTLPDTAKFLGLMDDLEVRHKDLQYKIVGRRLNKMAILKIAGFFNVSPDKLVLNSNPNVQGPASFGTK